MRALRPVPTPSSAASATCGESVTARPRAARAVARPVARQRSALGVRVAPARAQKQRAHVSAFEFCLSERRPHVVEAGAQLGDEFVGVRCCGRRGGWRDAMQLGGFDLPRSCSSRVADIFRADGAQDARSVSSEQSPSSTRPLQSPSSRAPGIASGRSPARRLRAVRATQSYGRSLSRWFVNCAGVGPRAGSGHCARYRPSWRRWGTSTSAALRMRRYPSRRVIVFSPSVFSSLRRGSIAMLNAV